MALFRKAAVLALVVLGNSGCGDSGIERPVQGMVAAASSPTFAAPGRIEGSSEPIEVGAGIDGVLEAVLANEGDRVVAGQVLARISCDDVVAAVSSADADAR